MLEEKLRMTVWLRNKLSPVHFASAMCGCELLMMVAASVPEPPVSSMTRRPLGQKFTRKCS